MPRAELKYCWRKSAPAPFAGKPRARTLAQEEDQAAPSAGVPLGGFEFDKLMAEAGLRPGAEIAVAVSGGGDSMALCLLAHGWCERHRGSLHALTVDHGLRAGSDGEAEGVGTWLTRLNISHDVLRWLGPKPATGLQAKARDARYGLMTEWAKARGIADILVAHNLEDQAETFLMRLERGAGIDGLAAMAPVARRDGVSIRRPLLSIPRARLRATLRQSGQDWIEDPSNENPVFQRTHARRLITQLAGTGIDAERLAGLTAQFRALRWDLDEKALRLLGETCQIDPSGYAAFNSAKLISAPADIVIRALSAVLMAISGRDYAPASDKISRLARALMGSKEFRPATLAGCRIIPQSDLSGRAQILVCREERHPSQRLVLTPGERLVWRGVFEISINGAFDAGQGLFLGALGDAGWAEITKAEPALKDSAMPFPARLAAPALFDEGGVIAVPHLGFLRSMAASVGENLGTIEFLLEDRGSYCLESLVSGSLRTIF